MTSDQAPSGDLDSRFHGIAVLAVVLAILAYLPTLGLPYISDDYVQVDLARQYGPVSGWPDLIHDALYRCRATSLILTYWTEKFFGLNAVAFHISGLALHLVNVWLIFALGFWKRLGWRYTAVAAVFFAIHEGHQEAVIWYAAIHELAHLVFALLGVHLWLRWLNSGRLVYYFGTLGMFLLALLSKESAVALVPIFALVAAVDGVKPRRYAPAVLPFAALAVAYFLLIYRESATHLHFNDVGTFSLSAPFWITWRNSMGRLGWIWGWLSVFALIIWRAHDKWQRVLVAVGWAGLALLPYSFLTYMPRVPSRHTYFAAVGLALIVSAGFWTVVDRFESRRWVGVVLAAIILVHNCLYLWIKKYPQYVERAEPTERLLAFATGVQGPVYIHCFPYGTISAALALKVKLRKNAYPVVSGRSLSEFEDRSNIFCWTPRQHWAPSGRTDVGNRVRPPSATDR